MASPTGDGGLTQHERDVVEASEKARADFLQKMYVQMFDDIKTQFQVVWQSVGVLAGTFAIFSLVEKNVIPIDIATALVVLVAVWLMAHTINASYWYNRNLVIIANIERQFLTKKDLQQIQYYFGSHRKTGKMMAHLRIQFVLGLGIAGVVLGAHFASRVYPAIGVPDSTFDPMGAIPYFVAIGGGLWLWNEHESTKKKYDEFIQNSPGVDIDTSGILFGIGHPAYDPMDKVKLNPADIPEPLRKHD